jgi:replication factor C large subunit
VIAEKEGVSYDEIALKSLARRAGGDMRAAINDFQTITALSGKLAKEHLDELSVREQKESIPSALVKIFKTTDANVAKDALQNIDENLDQVLLWIDENLPLEYRKPDELVRAYECVSRADVFNGRIRRWQHWRFLVYIYNLLTAGIATSKDERSKDFVKYRQSMRPLKIWQANMKYSKRLSIAEKIAAKTHMSTKQTVKTVLPYVTHIIRSNKQMGQAIIDEYELSRDEVGWMRK